MKKLIIKSATGSVQDFKIDAELDWTVRELKAHIYRHYPTHPPLTCQKLIHAGKLLLDHSTLSEAITVPLEASELNKENPVIIHLVAYERSNSITPSTGTSTPERVHTSAATLTSGSTISSSSRSGLRNRQPGTSQDGATSQQPQGGSQQQQTGQRPPSQIAPPLINPWLRPTGGVAPNPIPAVLNVGPGGGVAPGGGVFPGGYPFAQVAPEFYQAAYGAAYANQLQQWYYNYYRTPGMGPGVGGAGGVARDNLQNPQDLPDNPANAPNDLRDNDLPDPDEQDDVPVNAPGGVGMMAGAAAGGQGLQRRDLVDYLYMFSMISFLVFMAFLTGSVGRLLIFAAGLTFMLLNQAGFFSLRRRRQPTPPPVPRPAPNFDQQGAGEGGARPEHQREEGERERDGPDGPRQHQAAANHAPSEADLQLGPAQEGGEGQEQRPGVLSTILVFITSFFTSLVPQQRPNIQVN